jgi:pyruvate/2-oxoacid:ferredoxin oxidoreductase alpha subunit
MEQVPTVLDEARREFAAVFGRTPEGAITCYETEDAETVLIATNSIASTVRDAVAERRARGEKIGMVKLRLFRPVPRAEILAAVSGAKRVGVIERDHSPGSGGVFWGEVAVSMRDRSDILLQDYLVGLGGGDVTPPLIAEIIDDLTVRTRAEDPIWKGVAA